MTRSLIVLVLAAPLAACIQPPVSKSQTGPTITVTLDPDSGFEADNTDTNPYLTLPTNATQYSFKLIVKTNTGEAYDGNDYTHPDVTMATAAITLASANIPTLTLTVDNTLSDWTYTSQGITVPASFKNTGTMMVHADAHDASGLASNIVNFNCALK
ncbi:MAG TPA: hypothetical protein VL326_23610 [Kofleriaceae bacterium]|jgi:hypothetical protein|nr:hypothetical protein [Kofleriaceae bacterium]